MMVKNPNKVKIIRCYASMKYSSSVRTSRYKRSTTSLWRSKKTNKSLAMPSQSNNSNKVNKNSRTKQRNKHGSPRKFTMSSSISSTIKEVQGSSSGQKVQKVLTLSKWTGSTLQLLVRWLVGYRFSRRTAPRIFPIFCMNVPYYKGKKPARPFFRENSCSLIMRKNVLKNGLFWGFSTLVGFLQKSIPTMVTFEHLIW